MRQDEPQVGLAEASNPAGDSTCMSVGPCVTHCARAVDRVAASALYTVDERSFLQTLCSMEYRLWSNYSRYQDDPYETELLKRPGQPILDEGDVCIHARGSKSQLAALLPSNFLPSFQNMT